jgi:DNA repair exonuclease SbcCD ATPase subunit
MNRTLILFLCTVLIGSCVEQSGKYKQLQAQIDSIQVVSALKNAEFEEIFATLNEIEQGLKSIRETENLLQINSTTSGELSVSAREQIKNDIQYIAATLEEYKAQIIRLERDKKYQSTQFQKRLKSITEELESKQKLVESLVHQLEESEKQLTLKTQQIVSMDQSIATLKADLIKKEKRSEQQVVKMGEQERQIYSGYYIKGDKSELIAAKVLSKGGLFRAAKISYQTEQSAFNHIDIRNVLSIPLDAKKGKILSIHPAGTYTLDPDDNGLLSLRITNPISFWEHTKYLIIKIN